MLKFLGDTNFCRGCRISRKTAREEGSICVHSLYSFLLYLAREQLFPLTEQTTDCSASALLYIPLHTWYRIFAQSYRWAASFEFISFPITIDNKTIDFECNTHKILLAIVYSSFKVYRLIFFMNHRSTLSLD